MQALASGNFLEIWDVQFRRCDDVSGVEEVEDRGVGIEYGSGFEDVVVTPDGEVVKAGYEVYAGQGHLVVVGEGEYAEEAVVAFEECNGVGIDALLRWNAVGVGVVEKHFVNAPCVDEDDDEEDEEEGVDLEFVLCAEIRDDGEYADEECGE